MAKTQIDDLAVVLSASTDQLAGDLRAAVRMFEQFKKQVDAANGDTGSARAAAKEAAAQKKAAKEAADAHKGAAAAGVMSFGKIAGAAAIAGIAMQAASSVGLGLADVFNQVRDSVKMAADVERTAISFEVMLGSAEKAASLMADLRRYAAETPFGQAETTDAARQLLAYGTAADQVIPVLKMLGNITAPIQDTTKLKDMVYLFGTLQTQGRAYAQDIRQFSGRGIQIIPALAKELKVAEDEIHNLVEEGRIGFPQVARALESLQLKGGPFAGMMDKQAKSLHGLWEQASDAWARAKLQLGQVIVEEVGLKDIVKDLENLGNELAGGMDTQGLRQGIRLTADFAKGVAHVGYEFTKAGMLSGNIFGEMASGLPQFKETMGAVQNIINGMRDFKISPADVAELAVSVSKNMLLLTALGVNHIVDMGEALKTNVLDPMIEAIRVIRDVARGMRAWGAATGSVKNDAIDGIEKMMKYSAFDGAKNIARSLGMIDPEKAAQAMAPGQPEKQDAIKDVLKDMKRFGDSLKDITEGLDRSGGDIIQRLKNDEAAKKEAARIQSAEDTAEKLRKDFAAYIMFTSNYPHGVGQLSALNPVSPLAGLAHGAKGFQSELALTTAFSLHDFAALAPGMFGGGARTIPQGRLDFGNQLDPHIKELAKRLNTEFAPLDDLIKNYDDMTEALKAGKITQKVFDLGWQKELGGAAQRLGVGQTQLPEAMTQGSVEAVRVLNQFQAGNQNATVEDLLRQLIEVSRGRDMKATEFELKFGKKVEVAPMPH